MLFNLKYPICMTGPRRLNIRAWSELIPLAFTIIQMTKPRTFVELGVNSGESYCAFCQAVELLDLKTMCYAIDTWKGDEHTSAYGEEVFQELKTYHDPLYSSFSVLSRSSFDNAVNNFPDGAIDLLHIDGFHSYEAVKHDFKTWLPKMSDSGIILFHDTAERKDGFGVWLFWEEIKKNYPNHFEVPFGHGLGVLSVGNNIPDDLKILFNANDEEERAISDFFKLLGERNVRNKELAKLRHELLSRKTFEKDRKISEQEYIIAKKEHIIAKYESKIIYMPWLRRLEQKLRKKIISPIKNKIIKVR